MPNRDDTLPPDILQAHPPERGPQKKQYVILYSCCCCCCCCLHTIGGVIGAAVAGATGNYRADEYFAGKQDSLHPKASSRRLPSSQGLYWLSMLIVLAMGFGVGVVLVACDNALVGEMFVMLGLFLVMFGPAFLLAASLVMTLILAFRSNLRSQAGYWKSLGRITLGTVAGTIIGIMIMVVIGVAIVMFN